MSDAEIAKALLLEDDYAPSVSTKLRYAQLVVALAGTTGNSVNATLKEINRRFNLGLFFRSKESSERVSRILLGKRTNARK